MSNPTDTNSIQHLEATKYKKGWLVRPRGALGTCGWWPKPWTAYYTEKARSADEAVSFARADQHFE